MPRIRLSTPGLLVSALLLVLCMPAQASYYVYQMPDGSRLMTDRPQRDKSLKLIKRSRQVSNVGRVAAAGYRSSPAVNYLRFESLIHQAARRHQVDAALVKAVIRTESYFNPNATSRVGASGLMQLMPQTAAKYGVTDLYSPGRISKQACSTSSTCWNAIRINFHTCWRPTMQAKMQWINTRAFRLTMKPATT